MWIWKEACFLYSRSDSAKLIPPLCQQGRCGKEEDFINRRGNLAFTTHCFHTIHATNSQTVVYSYWMVFGFPSNKVLFLSVQYGVGCSTQQSCPNVSPVARAGKGCAPTFMSIYWQIQGALPHIPKKLFSLFQLIEEDTKGFISLLR